jgi:DNA-binding Lrp family transcriptional regulator
LAAWTLGSSRSARPTSRRADRLRRSGATGRLREAGSLRTSTASDYPEVVEVHKLSGDHCSMLKVRAASMEHFEGLLERLGRHGEMRTSVVLSTQYEGRPVEAPAEDFLRATHSQGWGG